jgi:2-amino-4-hydroxy-6-hydroxymethyldihydropteridine diphosphokinase
VLLPLAEIAPELEIGGTRLSELLSAVDSSGVERIADAGDRWWTA